jgi:hypothetical protein
MFQAKDKELAVLQQQHAVALKKLAEWAASFLGSFISKSM